jgi:hypothetical protein
MERPVCHDTRPQNASPLDRYTDPAGKAILKAKIPLFQKSKIGCGQKGVKADVRYLSGSVPPVHAMLTYCNYENNTIEHGLS